MPLQNFSKSEMLKILVVGSSLMLYQLKIIPYIIFSASSPTLGAKFSARAYL